MLLLLFMKEDNCKLEALGRLYRDTCEACLFSASAPLSFAGDEESDCKLPPCAESLRLCSDVESVFCFLARGALLRFSSGPFCGFSHTSFGLMHLRVCSHSPQARLRSV